MLSEYACGPFHAQFVKWIHPYVSTHKSLYNTVHYNMVLNMTQIRDGSQKCIDYIEK